MSSKGQSEDEIVLEVARRKAELKEKESPRGAEITVHNASVLSAYEIRQELNRREAFDFKDDDVVNFRSMLKRLMVELVKDEENQAVAKEQESKVRTESAMEQSKRIREEKKRAAMERSKQRQADPDYFKKISENNVKVVVESSSEAEAAAAEEVEDVTDVDADPFQTFKPKGRAKIFIR